MRRRRLNRLSNARRHDDGNGMVSDSPRAASNTNLQSRSNPEDRLSRMREIEIYERQMEAARAAELRRIEQALYLERRAAYERGFLAGSYARQAMGTGGYRSISDHVPYNQMPASNQALDADALRKQVVSEMLESCRVIAESNPNMDSTSFFKAVKQRSKKIV